MSWPGGATGVEAERRRGVCRWTVERRRGPVPDLLEWAEPAADAAAVARLHVVEAPGLVLGSTQSLDAADRRRAEAAGVTVSRRRSGGGAVLLAPGRQVWVDFFIAGDDPRWSDDVARTALWAGGLWSALIEPLAAGPVSLHSGRLAADRWGRLACFAGTGPGEVLVDGLKVVGVSQRRTRRRIRIQTTARLQPPLAPAAAQPSLDEFDLLDLPPAERAVGRAAMAARSSATAATEPALTEALLSSLEPPDPTTR